MNPLLTIQEINARVKQAVFDYAEIDKDMSIKNSDDLFFIGMSSRASVALMLGLESEFDIEFPEQMLRKDIFESVDSISAAILKILTANT